MLNRRGREALKENYLKWKVSYANAARAAAHNPRPFDGFEVRLRARWVFFFLAFSAAWKIRRNEEPVAARLHISDFYLSFKFKALAYERATGRLIPIQPPFNTQIYIYFV